MFSTTKRTGDPVYDTFIRRSLGTLLPDCIKQLSESRPADPIEFISNALYKAVDSELYKREKEQYLNDCLRESALLQKERDERKARLDMLLQAEKENKELLEQARQDEIKALTDLVLNAENYGIQLSPRSMQRIAAVKKEIQMEQKSEKPLQIAWPQSEKATKSRGKWVEVEEQITTDSGTVITMKTRKWQSSKRTSAGSNLDDEHVKGKVKGKGFKDEKRYHKEEAQGSIPSVGHVTLTDRGFFTFTSGAIGDVQPPDPLNRQLAPADNPDIWALQHFDCHTLYDHELYIRCDAEQGKDINQHASPPRQLVREYLDSVSNATSGEEGKHHQKSRIAALSENPSETSVTGDKTS